MRRTYRVARLNPPTHLHVPTYLPVYPASLPAYPQRTRLPAYLPYPPTYPAFPPACLPAYPLQTVPRQQHLHQRGRRSGVRQPLHGDPRPLRNPHACREACGERCGERSGETFGEQGS